MAMGFLDFANVNREHEILNPKQFMGVVPGTSHEVMTVIRGTFGRKI
jgi:hypothetical protein